MKAFKGSDQQVRLFRPWLNMDRMLRSALRLCLPVRDPGRPRGGREGVRGWGAGLTRGNPAQGFDKVELLECIRRLVEVDKDWVPDSANASLYVRPVIIGNEVGLSPCAAMQVGRKWGGLLRAGRGGTWGEGGDELGGWTPGSLMPSSAHHSPRWVSPGPRKPSCLSFSALWARTSLEMPWTRSPS